MLESAHDDSHKMLTVSLLISLLDVYEYVTQFILHMLWWLIDNSSPLFLLMCILCHAYVHTSRRSSRASLEKKEWSVDCEHWTEVIKFYSTYTFFFLYFIFSHQIDGWGYTIFYFPFESLILRLYRRSYQQLQKAHSLLLWSWRLLFIPNWFDSFHFHFYKYI